jgi:hypothetical protein
VDWTEQRGGTSLPPDVQGALLGAEPMAVGGAACNGRLGGVAGPRGSAGMLFEAYDVGDESISFSGIGIKQLNQMFHVCIFDCLSRIKVLHHLF